MFVYQAVPQQPAQAPGSAIRVVLVIDVPGHLEASAADAARLADEFGATLSHVVPGALARKAVVSAGPAQRPHVGLTVDLANRRGSIDGHPIRLAYREVQLFAYLAAQPHRTVSRATLLSDVWNDRRPGRGEISDRTVDTHVRRLRTKLGDHASVLTTVRGRGYRFDPGVDVRLRPGSLRRIVN